MADARSKPYSRKHRHAGNAVEFVLCPSCQVRCHLISSGVYNRCGFERLLVSCFLLFAMRRGEGYYVRPSPYSVSNVGGDKPREASWVPSNKTGASVTADKPRPVVTRVGVLGHASGGPSAPPRALQVVGTVRNSPTLPTARVAKGLVAKGPASLQLCPPDACVAKSEEVERRGLSSLFVALAEVVRAESSVLQSLEGYQAEQLVFSFADRAPSALGVI